jgi:signal transduction histidine kinase
MDGALHAFLAKRSHELRTPLNAILGYSDLLIEEAQERGLGDLVPDLKRIHLAGKHLLDLISEILDLAKIESGTMKLERLEDFMEPQRETRSESPTSIDPKPSEVTDQHWLYAARKIGDYPAHTERGGKWLIFVPVSEIDEVWAKIRHATEQGLLGSSAKVSTAMQNPNATSADRKVICVYTYDWTDEQDARRVRQALRELEITWKIAYKADEDTYAGKYANRGDKRISKYYE